MPHPHALLPGSRPRVVKLDAAAVVDAMLTVSAPGSLLLLIHPKGKWNRDGFGAEVLSVGPPARVAKHPRTRSADAIELSLPNAVLFPGMVNAHAHLDLTHIGPQPHDPKDGFVPWVDMIRSRRHADDDAIAESVKRGIELSLSAGVVAIADIGGAPKGKMTLAPWRALRDSGMLGASFVEFFGIGKSEAASIAALDRLVDEVQDEMLDAADKHLAGLGLQPHAPNTVGPRLYQRAAKLVEKMTATFLATHLAESIEERRFIARGDGPQRELLERFGLWTDDILNDVGHGRDPVDHFLRAVSPSRPPILAAHVNDPPTDFGQTLRTHDIAVAYCPMASDYFGAPTHFGPHRYIDMMDEDVMVGIGTDSIVNLPPGSEKTTANGGTGLSVLEQLRYLYKRDGVAGDRLLSLGTLGGAQILGFGESGFTFESGASVAGVVAVDVNEAIAPTPPNLEEGEELYEAQSRVFEQVLKSGNPPRLLFARNISG